MPSRFTSICTETRASLAHTFAAYALRAQRLAAIAKAGGDPAAWARHMLRASHLAHKADILGA